MSVRLGWACGIALLSLPCAAEAEEQEAPTAVAPTEKKESEKDAKPPVDHHRLVLGMGYPQLLAGSAGALGSLGPYGSAGYETRIAGPAWFMIAAHGGVSSYEDSSSGGTTAWSIGGTTGVRLEAPVFDFVDVGGYGAFRGAASQAQEYSAYSVGAVFGLGLHLRPTRFFGVRLGLEVLSAGYSHAAYMQDVARAAYANLTASPSLELTFSF